MIHRKWRRMLNYFFIFSMFGFLYLLTQMNRTGKEDLSAPRIDEEAWRVLDMDTVQNTIDPNVAWRMDLEEYHLKPGEGAEDLAEIGRANMSGYDAIEQLHERNFLAVQELRSSVGSVTNQAIIVVQVHNRVTYVKYLIESLRSVPNIGGTLVIFSHDIAVKEIDDLIKQIDFTVVLQIFYPYNMQLFPKVFPGQHPEDCQEKVGRKKAAEMKCRNFEHPDKYGNYRQAKLTQIKHHWWWKTNYVFDTILPTLNLNDKHVLFIEEDHYVAPDALSVLEHIITDKERLCNDCEIVSIGFYLKKTNNYGNDINRLGVQPWFSSKHNMGMTFGRSTYLKLKNCSEFFCKWDDYNWDWSMMKVSATCLPARFKVIFTKSPRVLHIGDCGLHTHRCTVHSAYDSAKGLITKYADRLFPSELAVTEVSRRSLKPSKENGGWGDIRDHQLCMLNASPDPDEWKTAPVLEDLRKAQVEIPLKLEIDHEMPALALPKIASNVPIQVVS